MQFYNKFYYYVFLMLLLGAMTQILSSCQTSKPTVVQISETEADSIRNALEGVYSRFQIAMVQRKIPNAIISSDILPYSKLPIYYLPALDTVPKSQQIIGPIPEDDGSISFLRIFERGTSYMMRASVIFLPIEEEDSDLLAAKADSIYALTKGRINDFADLARQFSKDKNAEKGGDLGWVKEQVLLLDIETAIKKHQKDEIFKQFIPKYGWYIVKVTEQHRREPYIEFMKANRKHIKIQEEKEKEEPQKKTKQ